MAIGLIQQHTETVTASSHDWISDREKEKATAGLSQGGSRAVIQMVKQLSCDRLPFYMHPHHVGILVLLAASLPCYILLGLETQFPAVLLPVFPQRPVGKGRIR